jgi:AhpD family alkylhydroperoxidase
MKTEEFEKIENIIRERKIAHEFFLKNSKVYNAFVNLEQKAFSDGTLKKKHKELIALGISIIVNCESCMEWHISEALRSGSTPEEILEAIEIGIEMGGGPATVSSRFALKVLEFHKTETHK